MHCSTTDLVLEIRQSCVRAVWHSQRICAGRKTKRRANPTHAAAASCTSSQVRRRIDRAGARDRAQVSPVAMRALDASRIKSPPCARCCPPKLFRILAPPNRLWITHYVTVTFCGRMALPRNGFSAAADVEMQRRLTRNAGLH